MNDLTFQILESPPSYDLFYDVQLFYTSLLASLNKCTLSGRLAKQYLSKAKIEANTSQWQYSPSSFTASNNTVACTNLFSTIFKDLDKILPFLSFAIRRVTRWISENNQTILDSTLATFGQSSEINSNLTSTKTKSWPGLWEILNFTSNFNETTWLELTENLMNPHMAANVSNCLLSYESALETAFNSARQSTSEPPYLFPNDTVGEILNNLDLQNSAISGLINSYYTGKITSIKAAFNTSSLLKNTSNNLSLLEKEWATMKDNWLDELHGWFNNIRESYTATIKSVYALSQFLLEDRDLVSSLSQMQMWYRPIIIIEPVVILKFGIQDVDSATQDIVLSWPNYFKDNALYTVSATLNDIENTIFFRIQKLTTTTKSLSNDWSSLQSLLDFEVSNYQSIPSIGDSFVM